MSIRLTGAAGINLGSDPTAGRGQGAYTLAFRIRFNWPPNSGAALRYFASDVATFNSTVADTASGRMNFETRFWLNAGTPHANAQMYVNTANHVVMTYDKDDATKQALYLNGKRTLMSPTKDTIFESTRSTVLKLGMFTDAFAGTVDFNVEQVLKIVGHALTPDEVNALRDGADPTTFGAGAAELGYWPLTGTPGEAVTADDAGIANYFDADHASTLYLGPTTPNTALVYDEAIPYVSQTGPGDFAVYTTGRFIRVGFNLTTTGAPVKVLAGTLAAAPTVEINGGDPIALESPLYDGTYSGVGLWLPDGVTIAEGDDVKITTAPNWIETAVGLTPGVTGHTVLNRAGKTVYGDLASTVKAGLNYSYQTKYWHAEHGSRNLARRCLVRPDLYTLRADQTVATEGTALMVNTAAANPLDRQNLPTEFGEYLVLYDDNDGDAGATEISVVCGDAQHGSGFSELTDYRNPGTAGVGKARVFRVQKCVWSVTLNGAVDATTTTLTLASTSSVLTPLASGNLQWIKVDDEYMEVSAVNQTLKTVTVIRGIFGSTAATHADGAVGSMELFKSFPQISLRFANATTHAPNYSNLLVLGPGDWSLPETVGPATATRTEDDMLGPSQFIKDSLAEGAGVCRYMDSTQGGFDRACEPEHLRTDDQLWPGEDNRYTSAATVVSSETATQANSPYMYTPFYLPNAETYPVDLAADIDDAQTTVTITADDANPVLYTSRLQTPAGETMRVLSVDGDSVEVVRACDGTTAAAQAAGPITAMWRVPTPSDAVFQSAGNVKIKQTTAVNHNLWNGYQLKLPSSNDLNPLARIDVTLTQDVPDATTTVFHVSVDPADAQYLAPGLFIVWDAECVRVKSYDPDAGTIVVVRAFVSSGPGRRADDTTAGTKVPVAHASGTVGTGSSGGVFCVSDDGLNYAWTWQASFGSTIVVTGPKSFVSGQANIPATTPADQLWYQVGVQTRDPILDDVSAAVNFAGPAGYDSYEHACRITKLAPGADHWLNIPVFASDDLVDDIARRVRDSLPAGQHRMLVEYGNEIWNTTSPRLQGAVEVGSICGFDQPGYDLPLYRGHEQWKIVRDVFEEDGRGSEVKFLVAWQQGSVGLMLGRAAALGIDSDVHMVSTAPYFRPVASDLLTAVYNARTDEECLDVWKFYFEYGTAGIGGTGYNDGLARRNYEASSGRAIEFIHYEGGPDAFIPVAKGAAVVTPPANADARNLDMHYNPLAAHATIDYLHILKRLFGSDGIAFFNHTQAGFYNGGANPYYSLWGKTTHHGQPAGKGDGSDGKADNRLCLMTPGKAGTKGGWVSQDASNVSTRMQGLLDYQAAYAAYNAVAEPTPATFALEEWRRGRLDSTPRASSSLGFDYARRGAIGLPAAASLAAPSVVLEGSGGAVLGASANPSVRLAGAGGLLAGGSADLAVGPLPSVFALDVWRRRRLVATPRASSSLDFGRTRRGSLGLPAAATGLPPSEAVVLEGAGGVALGASVNPAVSLACSGGAVAGGSASAAMTAELDGSGGATAGGAFLPDGTVELFGSGGAKAGGTAAPATTAGLAGAGGLKLGGSYTYDGTFAIEGSGGLVAGGSYQIEGAFAISGSGGAKLGGSATLARTAGFSGAGGAKAGGSYNNPGTIVLECSGGVALGGSAGLVVLPPQIGPFYSTSWRIGPDPTFTRPWRTQ